MFAFVSLTWCCHVFSKAAAMASSKQHQILSKGVVVVVVVVVVVSGRQPAPHRSEVVKTP